MGKVESKIYGDKSNEEAHGPSDEVRRGITRQYGRPPKGLRQKGYLENLHQNT